MAFVMLLTLAAIGCAAMPTSMQNKPSAMTLTPTAIQTPLPTISTKATMLVDDEQPQTPWSAAAHEDGVTPNYAVVFPDGQVNRMTITIAASDWAAMQENLTALLGPRDAAKAVSPTRTCHVDGATRVTKETPIWVPATITFNGQTWAHVGLRFKGNTSLAGAWHSGSLKLPLKLDFDQYEDTYREIKNQRFYGFKQLTLANAWGDPTYMRDLAASDLLHRAGLIASDAALYMVVLDYGAGPVPLGLYTAIEVVDDTAIARALGDDDGNIYQADGPGASLAERAAGQLRESYQKENNTDDADWSDIERLYGALHAPTRVSDAAAWRANLEATFDVDGFLRWLAVASLLEDWDTYGCVPHNYYLYDDPTTGRLRWVSWDHNQVLMGSLEADRAAALSRGQVGEDWPLIRYLLDDPVYADAYVNHIREVLPLFSPSEMSQRYQSWAALIRPRLADNEAAEWAEALATLDAETRAQYSAAEAFVATH